MNFSTGLFRHAVVLAAVLFFLTAPASAQRGKWWQSECFGRELGLTGDQNERLEQIFQKHQSLLRERMKALEQAKVVFDQRVETGDDDAVMKQADKVETARAELNRTRTRMRRSLTSDQWAKFMALAHKSRARSGHRAPPADRDRSPARASPDS